MPIHFEQAVTARCRPEHVWQKFQRLEQWPWWNAVIGQARWLQGQPWQNGSRFVMELARPTRVSFRPVIVESDPPHKIVWTGQKPGFRGQHGFSFEPQADGSTLIKTWEDASGLVTWLWTAGYKEKLNRMYRDWLEALKTEAERIAREEMARS